MAALAKSAHSAAGGKGGAVLISGEAGIGKSVLIDIVLAKTGIAGLRAAANPAGNIPLAPVAILLRALWHDGIVAQHKKAEQLRKLLLAESDMGANRAALFADICDLFAAIAHSRPLALVFDDLHWADQATLDLLPQLADIARSAPLLIVAAYRSDEIPRGHPMRATREALRRGPLLEELFLEPLDRADGMRLIERLAGTNPPSELAAKILDRSGGVPLFVEALVGVLKQRGGFDGDILRAASLPLPETLRDAITARVDLLSETGRRAAEAAAVGGSELAFDLLAKVNNGDDGLEELLEFGLLIERDQGQAAFRTPLARDAIYAAIPWTRRRLLHRCFAEALATLEHDAAQLAEHWQNAGDVERARKALVEGVVRARRLHAHGDAVQLSRRALDIWPAGQEEAERLAALDQLGDCAQLAGQFAEALRAWREFADSAFAAGSHVVAARALRKIANLHELSCDWARAIDMRQDAMAAFAAGGDDAEAAAEGITTAIRLRMSARYTAALEVLARAEIGTTGREDLKLRIVALKGNLEARLGRVSDGIASIRAALDAALALNHPAVAGEIYQRLADAEERSSKFKGAVSTNLQGVAFCEDRALPAALFACLACMGWILVRAGEWKQAIDASQRLLDSLPSGSPARGAALLFIGLVHVMRGELRRGEDLLLEAEAINRRVDHALGEVHSRWGLAMHAAGTGDNHSAAQRCRAILVRLRAIDMDHAFIPVLRWASTCFANAGDRDGLQACGEALGEYAASFSSSEPLSALAHALGEIACLDGHAAQAAEQFERAVNLIEEWDLPRERVESQLRAAAAYAVAGRHDAAVAFSREAGRGADRLGARPLAQAAAAQLRQLGEPLGGVRGPRGTRRAQHGGLTARQLEILSSISQGLTDKQIARGLRLSPRTVEMHVARALATLDCRTRAEAVRKATEFGILPRFKA
jgi:DNA-binding CsgD family transcriptional regulator/tetratricopeptide (TPR) repeat protein